jgi:hypothetical protein
MPNRLPLDKEKANVLNLGNGEGIPRASFQERTG